MSEPRRIQRRRSKGWAMPANTVYVGRPTRWGNEFEVGPGVTRKIAVERFALHLATYFGWVERETRKAFHPLPVRSTEFRDWLAPLRGKNLACWCPLGEPCHADLLLELANAEESHE
jgi:hypothetical protein